MTAGSSRRPSQDSPGKTGRFASRSPVIIRALGHPNISASHEKTLELTPDSSVTVSGTCIVGAAAEWDEAALLALRGDVRIRLRCGSAEDVVRCRINPLYVRGDPLIVRQHPEPQVRSFCIGADKGAAALDRSLIESLRQPDAELEVVVEPESGASPAEGALFVVGMPIGNPRDLSPRALATLHSMDLIVAEDTRTTRAMLEGTKIDILSLHDFNERARTPEVLARLGQGARIALVSEAGVPLISDPGFNLVSGAAAEGYLVTPVPGPDAVTASLSVAGLPADDFRFIGFLPRKAGARQERVAELRASSCTTVMFEAPHRLLRTLAAIDQALGARRIAVCRNLTKPGERVLRGDAASVIDRLSAMETVSGEYVIVVDRAEEKRATGLTEEFSRLAESLIAAGVPTKTIARALADATGASRRDMFAQVLTMKGEE